MTRPTLKTVTRLQGNNRALKSGEICPADFDLAFEEVPVLVKGFRRMVRELAYDVSEMALTTYITARAHGVKFTALPVFLVRDFHHANMVWNTRTPLSRLKDLEGKRVGVNRGYTVTTGVWARTILQQEHDVDLTQVHWAPSGDEHVASFVNPANVQNLGPDEDLTDALVSGQLAGVVGTKLDHADIGPMIPDAFNAARTALRERGLYPINHLVVVKDEVLAANPGLATQLFESFAASKALYVNDLKAGRISDLTAADRVHQAALEVMDDPLPYGIAPNQHVLEMLMDQVVGQGVIAQPMAIADLFAPETRELVG